MKSRTLVAITAISVLSTTAFAEPKGTSACSSSESWNHTAKWMTGFHEFTSEKSTTLVGFSEALQLKRLSQIMTQADFERDFAEYWVGRVLFNLKLDFVAWQAFQSVYENSNQESIKKAALTCLGEIQKRTPDLKVPKNIHSSLLASDSDKKDLADTVTMSLLQNLSQNFSQKLVSQLPEVHQSLVLGFYASQNRKYADAITHLQKFVSSSSATNVFFKNYLDQARLLLGRAYYSTGKYKESELQLQTVTKTSNYVIDAMSDLSWAYLQSNRFDDVLGIAMQLRVGSLRNTFAPEASMVAAMALNERCLFPESVKMINSFAKDYNSSFEWLNSNKGQHDIYAEVLKILRKTTSDKKDPSTVPMKISSEWLKSPSFLNRQVEINTLISHPALLTKIQEQAFLDQVKMTDLAIKDLSDFIHDVKIAKLKLKPGEDLSDDLGNRYILIKKQLRKLSRYYKASKTWKAMAKNYEKRIPSIRTKLVSNVNRELNLQNQELLSQLDRIRENSELIEIEIYNGASHDMIWKNAHPDFDKVGKSITEDKEKPVAATVWSWGRYLASELDDAEVWEDEMGALKADVSDQCQKKEKYLSLKLKR